MSLWISTVTVPAESLATGDAAAMRATAAANSRPETDAHRFLDRGKNRSVTFHLAKCIVHPQALSENLNPTMDRLSLSVSFSVCHPFIHIGIWGDGICSCIWDGCIHACF
jgi:hypothetical protein